ncbi:hypothetical protein [Methylobacterium sp. WL7]|uniref:hypothetical protein n=1 Tax=Methylobacterium sp. WL7 TaxID=2603900 RepID=UPI0011CA6655|nr:hypothetical protein [Methylobacterium sp. WL7]TXN40065.1 hypothetical protein FV233_27180 [Methylobacterium sp. WL7]
MTNTITLTREQDETIWSQLKQVRNSTSDLCGLRDACDDLGMTSAVAKIERSQREIADAITEIATILLDAQRASFAQRSAPKRFFSLNKSNREA